MRSTVTTICQHLRLSAFQHTSSCRGIFLCCDALYIKLKENSTKQRKRTRHVNYYCSSISIAGHFIFCTLICLTTSCKIVYFPVPVWVNAQSMSKNKREYDSFTRSHILCLRPPAATKKQKILFFWASADSSLIHFFDKVIGTQRLCQDVSMHARC